MSRSREAHSRAGWAALALVTALAACSTDTSGLVRRDPEDEAAMDAGGAGGTGSGSGAGGSGGGDTQQPVEGPGALSVVHGVVDGGHLFVCLRDAETREPLAGDVPLPGGGLPYGRALQVDLALLERDVEVELIALEPARAGGATCTQLALEIDASLAPRAGGDAGVAESDAGADAGGPPFPQQALVPRRAGTVSIATAAIRAGAHDILVASGCATPSPPAGQAATEGCGAPDMLFGSYQSVSFVELGTEPSQPAPYFGLQFLNASRAIGSAEVVLQGQNQDTQSVRLASAVPFGALRPRAVTSVLEPVGIELQLAGGEGAEYVQTWEDTLAQSLEGPLELGARYALIYVGPLPGPSTSGFAPPRFLLIPRPLAQLSPSD